MKLRALWAVLLAWLRGLFTRPDPVAWRLNRLRAVYRADPAAGLHNRRVRNLLREQVAPEYHTHYDRLLRMEQVTTDLLRTDIPSGLAVPDLLPHVYSLTERVARLIEQLQRGDKLMGMYPDGSAEQEMVADARRNLIARIDETIALQESIPARLMQLSAASTGRDSGRLRETLADLNARLEGMADSYNDLSIDTIWQRCDTAGASEKSIDTRSENETPNRLSDRDQHD
jgi:hypothetical protein